LLKKIKYIVSDPLPNFLTQKDVHEIQHPQKLIPMKNSPPSKINTHEKFCVIVVFKIHETSQPLENYYPYNMLIYRCNPNSCIRKITFEKHLKSIYPSIPL